MKNSYKLYVATATALIATSVLPAFTFAVAAVDGSNSVPPPPTASGDSMSGQPNQMPPIPANLPPEIRAKIEQAEKNRMMGSQGGRDGMMASTTRPGGAPLRAEMRKDIRGAREDMKLGSSTRPVMGEIRKEVRGEMRDDMMRDGSSTRPFPPMMTTLMRKFASTTEGQNMMDRLQEYKQDVKQTRLDIFAAKQNRVVEELTNALNNLKQIRTRVSARIDTETAAGKDLSEAKALLVTADAKIAAAGTAIQALASYTPPAALTSAIINASSTVDISKPRQIGADAIKAVNDARKALNDVVRSIGKALGLKMGDDANRNGSTTPGLPPVPPPSTNQ